MADAPRSGGSSAPITDVVTCFLRHRGDVLLVRRSDRVGSYQGRWGAVSGYCEAQDALDDAYREIAEETGLDAAVRLVRRGTPFTFEDHTAGRSWRVHPFLFDAGRRDARLDWEAEEGAWVAPTEILDRTVVPQLWSSYLRVAPTLDDIVGDREHGSAYLSLRALEVLRDRAAALAHGVDTGATGEGAATEGRPHELIALAMALRDARPGMAAVRNRIDRAMTEGLTPRPTSERAASGDALAERVARAAQRILSAAVEAEDAVARRAAELVAGKAILTLSMSGTVREALLAADPPPAHVVVLESHPGSEGRALARVLSRAAIDTVLVPDAAAAWAVERYRPDVLLAGADTVLADGSVVNKVGTRPAALAAREAGVRVLAAAARDKVAVRGTDWTDAHGEPAADPDDAPGEAGAAVRWCCPLFERTPAPLIDGVVCESGVLTRAEVAALAAEHAERGSWSDGPSPS